MRCRSASTERRVARGAGGRRRPAIVRRRSSRSESPRRAARGRGARSPSSRNGTKRRTQSRSRAVPAPSRAPRRSHACAANISSIATTRAPSPTISSSRLAASGAIVIRSSIPSAWVVETSSNDTGCASSRASTAIAWIAMPYSLSALSARPGRAPRPSVSPVRWRWRSFTARSAAVEIAGASASRATSSAVASGCISKLPTEITLSSSTTTSGFDCAALSSIASCDARRTPSASRAAPFCCAIVRNVSGSCRSRASTSLPSSSAPRRASVDLQARVGPRLADRRVRPSSGSRRAPRGRARPRGRRRRAARARRRTRARRSRGEGALVEERDRLAAGELEVAEEAVREVGHLGEVALADRAERADLRQPVGVQRRDEVRRELGPGAGRRPREGVREPQRRRPHDLVRDGSALRDPVLADEQPVVPVGVDVEHLAAADPRRDPVGGRARRRSSGRRPRAPRPSPRAPPGSISTCAPSRDREDVVEREVGAGQDDGVPCLRSSHHPAARGAARTALPTAQSANAPAATSTIVPPGGVSA